MTPEDFFVDREPLGQRVLSSGLLERIRSGEHIGRSDVEVGVALLRLAHDELEAFGADGAQRTSEDEMRLILRACRLLLKRIGVDLALPFSDFRTFRSHWMVNGCYGNPRSTTVKDRSQALATSAIYGVRNVNRPPMNSLREDATCGASNLPVESPVGVLAATDRPYSVAVLHHRLAEVDERPIWRGRTHLWAFGVALPATVVLVAGAHPGRPRLAALIYAISLVAMFGFSAAHHRLGLIG